MNKFLIAAILGMVVLAALAQAPATGTVKGSVTLNGTPVAGAKIVVSSSGDSSYSGAASTDASGNFTVSNTPVGSIVVKAYDSQGQFLASATGNLAQAGSVISLTVAATR